MNEFITNFLLTGLSLVCKSVRIEENTLILEQPNSLAARYICGYETEELKIRIEGDKFFLTWRSGDIDMTTNKAIPSVVVARIYASIAVLARDWVFKDIPKEMIPAIQQEKDLDLNSGMILPGTPIFPGQGGFQPQFPPQQPFGSYANAQGPWVGGYPPDYFIPVPGRFGMAQVNPKYQR